MSGDGVFLCDGSQASEAGHQAEQRMMAQILESTADICELTQSRLLEEEYARKNEITQHAIEETKKTAEWKSLVEARVEREKAIKSGDATKIAETNKRVQEAENKTNEMIDATKSRLEGEDSVVRRCIAQREASQYRATVLMSLLNSGGHGGESKPASHKEGKDTNAHKVDAKHLAA